MDLYTINKYIASNENISKVCDNPYHGQKHYFENGMPQTFEFCPFSFVCKNAKRILVGQHTTIFKNKKYPKIPHTLYYEYEGIKYKIINNSRVTEKEENIITELYLRMIQNESLDIDFDYIGYYSIYNEYINFREKYVLNNVSKNIKTKTCLFYIEYGFWEQMYFTNINGLLYIASNKHLIKDIGNDENSALFHYFNDGLKQKLIIDFNPCVYIASNIDKLKDHIEDNVIKEREATLHYIHNGYFQNLSTDDFDHFTYLANNPKRIRHILKVDTNVGEWDLNKLVKSIVAKDYLCNHKFVKKRKFDSTSFVRKYIGNEDINFDRKLNIDNASYYFVRGYVENKKLRKTLSAWNKCKSFFYNRFLDSLKQVPINVTKLIIQNKL